MSSLAFQRSAKKRDTFASGARVWRTVVIASLAILWTIPIAWIALGSLRTNADLMYAFSSDLSWRTIWPAEFTLDNYKSLLTERQFGHGMLNSLLVTGGSVVVGLVVALAAAYALSVFHFKGREVLFAVTVIAFMVPFEAIAIPLSQQFSSWSLTNTYLGLALPGLADGMAIFYLRQAFLSVPPSFREAAQLDGASEPRILFSIFSSMSIGPLTNAAFLIFVGQWSAYIWPLLSVTEDSHQLAPVLLARTFGQHSANYAENFAGSVLLMVVPAIAIFLMQRILGRTAASVDEK